MIFEKRRWFLIFKFSFSEDHKASSIYSHYTEEKADISTAAISKTVTHKNYLDG